MPPRQAGPEPQIGLFLAGASSLGMKQALLIRLCLLLPGCAAMAFIQDRPLHSISGSWSWVCAPGFYRTAPPNPGMATCRPCRGLAPASCRASEYFAACSPTSDAQCVACPSLPPQLAYTGAQTNASCQVERSRVFIFYCHHKNKDAGRPCDAPTPTTPARMVGAGSARWGHFAPMARGRFARAPT